MQERFQCWRRNVIVCFWGDFFMSLTEEHAWNFCCVALLYRWNIIQHALLDTIHNTSRRLAFHFNFVVSCGTLRRARNVDSILPVRFYSILGEVAKNPKDSLYKLGKPLNDISKVVFSKKLKTSKWDNATIVKGNIAEEIKLWKRKR